MPLPMKPLAKYYFCIFLLCWAGSILPNDLSGPWNLSLGIILTEALRSLFITLTIALVVQVFVFLIFKHRDIQKRP